MKWVKQNHLKLKVFSLLCFTGMFLSTGWTAPSAAIYGSKKSFKQNFKVYVSFSESVAGFSKSDIAINNGTISAISGSEKYYEIFAKATKPGDVTIKLPANAANATQNSDGNTASNTFVTKVLFEEGLVTWIVDNNNDWNQSGSNATNLSITNGKAKPTNNTATYSSTTKVFDIKRKAQNITFKQSPVWDNWTSVSNVGPSDAKDAPILLPIGNNDYYFFGKKNDVYNAWHSTDMINWTNHGPIADASKKDVLNHPRARWATSAEYKDGKFYIITDTPNDQDPALIVDDNLKDGKFGTFHGTVFHDPSQGSDASLFRDDADDLFHIIYEDWSPIDAKNHAWDSPLAGHTSSEDAINGFIPHEHHPAVDQRTTPTGAKGTYTHATSKSSLEQLFGSKNGSFEYDIHSPEQNAYGDWTTIKVGGQYYLFGDYEEAGTHPPEGAHKHAHLKTGRLTSSSIYEEFKLVGETGSGHPDPTVGFAEGQFYLITQQSTDQVSPGPWVEDVEARAGVDVDGNGSIDQWTNWKFIKETYDHKPGYARVVDVTPAELDLSTLPEGFGFKFEFKVTDKTLNSSTPIMDKVEMNFSPLNNASSIKKDMLDKKNLLNWNKSLGTLNYLVSKPGVVTFVLYNLQGQKVKTIQKQHTEPGTFSITFSKENTLSWSTIEYQSPSSLNEKIHLTH